ncbi:hypothetical protein L332_03625 [Agrococcus pavilionensis RW1]|uniref:DUF7426 domain-containing protein n=1 Tax=Agrococcus pavilionensis RW1 TaxID=1330458 RepID=U1MNR8_9MICO|nr:hypothetical protein [Agrococcus pavilionensis]ERG63541.1 hypothetical protein L332_03625 [Agrococcus pavilionensis RW1]
MGAVDFEEWAAPTLDVTLGGRTFVVQPPSVDAMKKVLAAAARAEINLGIVPADQVPDGFLDVLESIGPDEHPALGATWDEMVEARLPQFTIDRIAYYAVFYWARGKAYADWIAVQLWAPRELGADDGDKGGDASPKARPSP